MVAMIATRLLFFAAMWNIASASMTLAHSDKECDITHGEIYMPSSQKASSVAECLSSCTAAKACRSVTYYPSGFCSHFITHCKNTQPSAGAKSYTIDADTTASIQGSKYLGEKCSEGAMASPGYVFHMDFCLELCAQSNECNSITYGNTGYCYHFTSNCDKRTSMPGAVSFQVKPFSTSTKYEITSCDKTCEKDASKYLSKTSGYVLTLKDCLDSCSRLAECDSVGFHFDGFCSHFGHEQRKTTDKMDRVCHVRANKCLKNNGGCDSKRPCTETGGSVKCEDCPAGYANDGATGCKDVNECAKDNGGCDGKRACTNTDGSMSCRDCPAGYENDGPKKCKDVDECATKNGGCDSKRKCTNTDGSFKCENCPAGYVNDGGKGCKDVDECATNNGGCDSNRKCTNTPGSYKCETCAAGYVNDGAKGCKDVNECATNNGGCDIKRKCTNTVGSFKCEDCSTGYENDGAKKCKDVNECDSNNGGCDSKRQCINTEGSSICGLCSLGYTTDGPKGCKDVNECDSNNGGCHSARKCTNTAGSSKCEPCAAGYVNNGAKGCTDINECASNNGGCHSKRICTNTPGSFKCEKCEPESGWRTEGLTSCRRKNPCPVGQGSNPCEHENGGCHFKRACSQNTAGQAICSNCPAGYDTDGPKGCKANAGVFNQVCDDSKGEIWIGEPKVKDMDACIKSCQDTKDCLSVSFYTKHEGDWKGCSHWKTMCRTTKPRDGVLSKNVKGDALNRLECDVVAGEKYITKIQTSDKKECHDKCMNHGTCNSFTYYNHGSCSFFSTCCFKTTFVHNAHTECWRLPPL